jgi:DNA polymerase III epsilon subunit-like protein
MGALPEKSVGAIRYVVFDTETTGLPDKRKVGKKPADWRESDPQDWPELLQLTAEVYEVIDGEHTKIGETLNWWVNTDTPIPKETSDIHGITNDFLNGTAPHLKSGEYIDGSKNAPDSPVPARYFPEVAREILDVLNDKSIDFVIAHNMPYDEWVLRKNLQRHGFDQDDLDFERDGYEMVFDTTVHTAYLCKMLWLNSPADKPDYKRPSLEQLYGILFPGEEIGDAHDAREDVKATVRVVKELYRRNIFSPDFIRRYIGKPDMDLEVLWDEVAEKWKSGETNWGSKWKVTQEGMPNL